MRLRVNPPGIAKRGRPIVARRAPGRPHEARIQLAHGVRRGALGRGSVRSFNSLLTKSALSDSM